MLFLIYLAFIKNDKLQYSDHMFPIFKILKCPCKKIHFPFVLLKRRTPPKMYNPPQSFQVESTEKKRNSSRVPFQKSSTVSPQEKYSFFQPNMHDHPNFLLL